MPTGTQTSAPEVLAATKRPMTLCFVVDHRSNGHWQWCEAEPLPEPERELPSIPAGMSPAPKEWGYPDGVTIVNMPKFGPALMDADKPLESMEAFAMEGHRRDVAWHGPTFEDGTLRDGVHPGFESERSGWNGDYYERDPNGSRVVTHNLRNVRPKHASR
jgi:hypothetical protein